MCYVTTNGLANKPGRVYLRRMIAQKITAERATIGDQPIGLRFYYKVGELVRIAYRRMGLG